MFAVSSWTDHWPYVAAPYVFYSFCVFWLLCMGDHGDERNPVKIFFKRISVSLERLTGRPGWAMAGVLSGLLALGVAVVGLYWDVAWHIDFGRDKELFTPSHTMILLGLSGMMYASIIAVIFATLDKAPVGFQFAGLTIPWSALMLAVLGFGGVAAFPLDELWHRAYGVDVTLWSPSHLQLIAGGSLGPIAVLMMLLEGRPQSRSTILGHVIEATAAGAVLVGLTNFLGEFEYGVPQFQALYFPLLIVLAAAFSLVMARLAIGPGGAVAALAAYLVVRGTIALLVGGALNHTTPRFPLYLAAALCVEGVAALVGTRNTLRFGLISGAAVGTVGLAGEMVFTNASGWLDSAPVLLVPAAILGLVAGVSAAVLGAGIGRAWRQGDEVAASPVPLAALAVAGLAVVVTLAIPLPRNVGDVGAAIRLVEPAADGTSSRIAVDLTPADAADNAISFGVMSWQGGGRKWEKLEELSPGHWETADALPLTGDWKTMVSLMRGSQVMAAPVYMPADAEIGASAVPALPERQVAFERNTSVLLREAKDGPSTPAVLAYGGVALVTALWIGLFSVVGRRLSAINNEAPVPLAGRFGPSDWGNGNGTPTQPPAADRPYARTWASTPQPGTALPSK
ncbi:MAG: hypothetical protein ACRD0N_01170 [Acidimicrobiales bacterium]